MKNTAYHQAQLMAEYVSDDIQQYKSEVLAKVDSIVTPNPVSSASPVPSIPPTGPAIYASTHSPSSSSDNDVLRLIEQLQQQLMTLQNAASLPYGGGRQTSSRRTTSKYCWTHGACAHSSKDCRNRKDGHRDDATFANKLGGCTVFCKTTNT